MLYDPTFWVACAFLIFVGLVFKPAKNFLIKNLDNRSEQIRKALNEALELKEEAQALLASYQRKQREAETEAKQLIEEAEIEALALSKKAEEELELALNRRIELAMQKIASHEAAILHDVRQNALNIASDAVTKIISKQLSADQNKELVNKSINELSN